MRKAISTIVFMIVAFSVYSQTDSIGNWFINMSVGVEAHDKRLFNYSEKESLLEMQPEFWGTYHFGFDLKRRLFQNERLSSLAGLGVSFKKSTFIRPFDHFHFKEDSAKILRNLNRYQKVQFPLTINVLYQLTDNWIISGLLSSNILLFRSIDHTENNANVFPYSENTFELVDVNLRLGINYKIDKWIIGFNSRVINFQKIDKIIFNDIIKDPRSDQYWEWNNPLRFDFIIGYMW